MNGAFVDTLENDLEVLKRMNRMARSRKGGPGRTSGDGSEPIEFLEISPSERVNQLAVDYYDELPKGMARYINPDSSSTMLSLILFEQGYCNRLADLGFHDAMAKEDEIRDFLKG
ncbi:MAG: patatin-like phospholipase family protein, partial [Gammaproteobacteria bacterium]|nr:patatin-like phospholipase family protein [Gammaproteobacteria bacterium]